MLVFRASVCEFVKRFTYIIARKSEKINSFYTNARKEWNASMKQETSQWGKAVKKAVIDHDMTLKQLAEKIGYSNATVSQVVNGRYSNSSYKVIAEKINEVLGTEGLPERTETPSDEWCQTVKVELVKQSMTVNELAKQLDVSRDRLSLVINGKMMNEAIVSGVNNLLGINLVAVPADK